jgi:hypothetical protein
MRGILPIIPPIFDEPNQQRRNSTRYNKTILLFESFLNLAPAQLPFTVQPSSFARQIGEQMTLRGVRQRLKRCPACGETTGFRLLLTLTSLPGCLAQDGLALGLR